MEVDNNHTVKIFSHTSSKPNGKMTTYTLTAIYRETDYFHGSGDDAYREINARVESYEFEKEVRIPWSGNCDIENGSYFEKYKNISEEEILWRVPTEHFRMTRKKLNEMCYGIIEKYDIPIKNKITVKRKGDRPIGSYYPEWITIEEYYENELAKKLAFAFEKLYSWRGGLNGHKNGYPEITGDDFDLYMKTWSMGGKFKGSDEFDNYLKALGGA